MGEEMKIKFKGSKIVPITVLLQLVDELLSSPTVLSFQTDEDKIVSQTVEIAPKSNMKIRIEITVQTWKS